MSALPGIWRWSCLLTVLASVFLPRAARADAPNPHVTPVHVLTIDSDDAEDQADALSGALRSRVRTAPGWSLQETAHSLSMLTAALRCPQRPDAACLQRIADQIHADRFIWGVLSKVPGNQVSAELHLWVRGKPDTIVRETYSDNLKDQNDEALRKIAVRVLDRLGGGATTGTVTVHAGEAGGQVLVNGQRKGMLERGAATIDLPPGSYVVEVRAPGMAAARQQVAVAAGADAAVTLKLVPETQQTEAPPPATASKPASSTRKIIAWSTFGVGAALGIVGVVEGIRFLSLKDDLNADRGHVDRNISDLCTVNRTTNPYAGDGCDKFNDAKSARTLGLIFGGAGAALAVTGLVLLLTDHSGDAARDSATPKESALSIVPYGSARGGGVDVGFAF